MSADTQAVQPRTRCSECDSTSPLHEYFQGWRQCFRCGVLFDKTGAAVEMTYFPYLCSFENWDAAAQARADAFIAAWESGKRGNDLALAPTLTCNCAEVVR